MKQYSKDDVEIVGSDELHSGFFTVNRLQIRFKLFNGKSSDIITREVISRFDAVGVLPYDPLTDQIVLIEQFRPGALGQDHSPWLLELVAGLIDKEESIPDVAAREMQEESGLDLLALEPICDYLASPGGSDERLHLFCGRVNAGNHGKIFGLAEESEDIKVHVLSCDDAFALVRDGKINNAATLIVLQWLMLEKDRLRAKWGF